MRRQGSAPPWGDSSQVLPLIPLLLASESPSTWGAWLRHRCCPTGTLVLLSLAYLTSLFCYIPKAALAAVIISAVVPMFDARIFRTLWRVKSEGTSVMV